MHIWPRNKLCLLCLDVFCVHVQREVSANRTWAAPGGSVRLHLDDTVMAPFRCLDNGVAEEGPGSSLRLSPLQALVPHPPPSLVGPSEFPSNLLFPC